MSRPAPRSRPLLPAMPAMPVVPVVLFVLLGLALVGGASPGADARTLAAAGPLDELALRESDRDGDGLSDFHERHKYRTDPDEADSDGDGKPDSDWNERREYTYTIRSLIRVLPPVDVGDLDDDYQDALVLAEEDEFVELEVVHYPLCDAAGTIEGDPRWRQQGTRHEEFLRPGPTTNWDAGMARELRRRLAEDGIELDALDDVQTVEAVSRWALEHAEGLTTFTTFLVHCPQGRPEVYPGLEDKFQRKKYREEWSVEDQLEHEVLGKGMFEHRTRGSCTSSAVYLSTVLRAVGIPTRMILTIPLVDASNPDELNMVERALRHHEVRTTVMQGLEALGQSFAAHTYNEVFVGGRWRRLNYTRLGQPILDPHYLGLMTRIQTFHDLADAALAPTWGTMSLTGWPQHSFRRSNPYSALSVDDRFGRHARLPNPPARSREHDHAAIVDVYWFEEAAKRHPSLGPDAFEDDGHGHLLMVAADWIDGEGAGQYADFFRGVDKQFSLRAEGRPPIPASAQRGYWANHFYLHLDAANWTRMEEGVEYQLVPRNQGDAHRWKVDPGVRLLGRRPGSPPPVGAPRPSHDPREHWMEDGGHRHAVIDTAYWFDSPRRPEMVPDDAESGEGGHLFLHARHWVNEVGAAQYATFFQEVDRRFRLEAEGHRPIEAEARRGSWRSEFYVFVPPEQFQRMQEGVDYHLVARNANTAHRWLIDPPIVVRKGEDPEAAALRTMTWQRIRNPDDRSFPDWVHELDLGQGEGRVFLVHVAEWDDALRGDAIKHLTEIADRRVRLEARGRPSLEAQLGIGCITSGDGEVRELFLIVPADEVAKARRGTRYTPVPHNESVLARWVVEEGLELRWN